MQHVQKHRNGANGSCKGLLQKAAPQCSRSNQRYFWGLVTWEPLLCILTRFVEHGTIPWKLTTMQKSEYFTQSVLKIARDSVFFIKLTLVVLCLLGLILLLYWGGCNKFYVHKRLNPPFNLVTSPFLTLSCLRIRDALNYKSWLLKHFNFFFRLFFSICT